MKFVHETSEWKRPSGTYAMVSVMVVLAASGVSSGQDCGQLYEPEFQGRNALIRYEPNPELKPIIMGKYNMAPGFRFIFKSKVNRNLSVISLNARVQLDGFNLRIVNCTLYDEGLYRVQCYRSDINYTDGQQVNLEIPLLLSSTEAGLQESGLTHRDIAIIVVALCAVIIVLIIMVSLVAIFRTRRRLADGSTTLVRKDDSSFNHTSGDKDTSDVYDIAADSPTESALEACHGIHRMPRGTVKIRTEYSQIDEAKMLTREEIEKLGVRGANSTETTSETQYTVIFPEIKVDALTTNLYQNIGKAKKEKEIPEYAKPIKRSEKRKSRMKGETLQYVTVDLPRDEGAGHHRNIPVDKSKLTETEYAQIDHEKSNFRAPIRKAPSSWYKRKERKNRS